MARKYMISKVTIQNLSRLSKDDKGFTLIELIVGLSIMLIVGGLAMNALIQASTSFNKDKKSIDSNQSMSVILEMIGNDIRQAGENINDGNFPSIEFKVADATETNLKSGSSKIIIRRALISPLTLCEAINANQSLTTLTSPAVGDNATATVAISSNCDVATSSSPLSLYRVPIPVSPATTPATYYPITYYPTSPSVALPTTPTPLSPKLPIPLRKLRDYRCELDDPNPTTKYDAVSNTGTDFCNGNASEALRIAVSNSNGQFLIFNQTGEIVPTTNTADDVVKDTATTSSTKKYQIAINNTFVSGDTAITTNSKNNAVAYPVGSPIYVIEERIYTLSSSNSLQVSIDGKTPQTLIKKIDNFRISARIYTNSTDRIVQATPAANVCTDATPFAAQPTTPDANNPKYICKFNYFTGVTVADKADWKTLAGIKVEVQTKYDGTGQGAENPSNPSLDSEQVQESKKKLYAASEYFPRNVLSK
jgi:prepilin-type N-terminal cleavage/methylation domain-containing protein